MVTFTRSNEFAQNNISELISIEWAIFGITIAFFAIWNGVFLNDNSNFKNPNQLTGLDRIHEMIKIKNISSQFDSIVLPILLLVLNTFFLLITTCSIYVYKADNTTMSNLLIVSFNLCANTLIYVLLETLWPMIKAKIDFSSKIQNFDLDCDSMDNISIAVAEEIAITLFKKQYPDTNLDTFKEDFAKLKTDIVDIRNKKSVDKTSTNDVNNQNTSDNEKKND